MAATHTKMGSTQEEAENLQQEHRKFETTAAVRAPRTAPQKPPLISTHPKHILHGLTTLCQAQMSVCIWSWLKELTNHLMVLPCMLSLVLCIEMTEITNQPIWCVTFSYYNFLGFTILVNWGLKRFWVNYLYNLYFSRVPMNMGNSYCRLAWSSGGRYDTTWPLTTRCLTT